MRITILGRGDEAALEAFLAPLSDSSMFLRSNARRAGLVDGGQSLQATYAAAWQGDAIVAVAACSWTGMLLLQVPAPEHLEVARVALQESGRAIAGLSGPVAQVRAARTLLGLDGRAAALDDREDLFALSLPELRLPPALADGRWLCRAPQPDELPLLVRWRIAYAIETLGATAGPALDADVARAIHANPPHTVLVVDGAPVASTTFNARLPDVVQVGGVYTPPALRGRGYARAAVAGSLVAVRDEGAGRAVLFTGNPAARRAYEALGFVPVGDMSLVIF
jgi:RimJ/RimL family protein N-acetyltransferase